MWTFLVQINTSVVGKTIYSKNNDSETKKDLCFDHPSCSPVRGCLIGEELQSSYLDLEWHSLQAALCCSLQTKMLGGLHFIKDAVGELYEFVSVWGTGDKIIGGVDFLGFVMSRSSVGRGYKSMDPLCIVFRSSHLTLVNVEMKGSPEQVIWGCAVILSCQCTAVHIMWSALLIDKLVVWYCHGSFCRLVKLMSDTCPI